MNSLDHVLTEMDFNFLSEGEHSMPINGLRSLLAKDDATFILLDVRTEKELNYVTLPFATHIPLHELPHRLDELPKDKLIVTFCSSIFRSAVAYTYLLANGYDNVKSLTDSMENLVKIFKPSPLANM